MGDVTVRGAGIFGLSIAWACQSRGASVRVIDPGGVAAGSSGGIVGALAPHVPENWNDKKAFQLDSLLMAQAFWDKVEQTGGVCAGYGRTGRLQPLADEKAVHLARARVETARDLWGDRATWQIIDADDAGPWAPSTPSGLLIHDTLSARVHPRQACAALAAAIAVRGGQILTSGADQGAVVWATGADDLQDISARLNRPVGNGVKGQAALLRHNAGPTAPQIFADTVHIVPHADGTVAIGSTSERTFEDPAATDNLLDDIIDRARAALPILHGAEVIQRWAGVRPRAKSRAPMLGEHPIYKSQFIANGGFKIGFGMAPKIAEIMADLVLEGIDAIPDAFRVSASL